MSRKKSYTNNEKLDKIVDKVFDILKVKEESQKQLIVKIVKFVIVGGIATIISGVTFFLIDTFTDIPVLISNTIAFCVSVIYNYWASCKYVFEVNKEKSAYRRFIEFMVFSIIGYGINQLLLWTFADYLKWNHMLAWFIATAVVMVFNFITRQLFLEKRKKK